MSEGKPKSAIKSDAISRQLLFTRGRLAVGIALLCLVAFAVGLRLVPVVFVPSMNWGDEIFQSIEPAHRLIYGSGLVTWEFQLGMRSWLLPGAIAGLMELARLIGNGPNFYLPVIAIGLGLLGSAPVVCCFLWCRRTFGLYGALVAAAAAATAPELVYFGARALNEVVAAHLLIIAVYLLEPELIAPGVSDRARPSVSRWRLAAGGVLLGIAFLLRIQLAPAVAVIGLWSAGRAWRVRLPILVAGGLVAVMFGAVVDWLTLGYPLASVWRDLFYNVHLGVSTSFGVQPWDYYLKGELGVWLGAAPLVLGLIGVGARRMPLLLATALMVIAVHSAIPHKEYRFIYPAIVLLMVLAAIGLANLTGWLQQLLARGMPHAVAAAVAAALLVTCWSAAAFNVWSSGVLLALRGQAHNELRAMSFARLREPCGIGIYGDQTWVRYGGYTYLHRPIPMFWAKHKADLAAAAGAFDVLMYRGAPPLRLGFKRIRCFGKICVAQRPGPCARRSMPPLPFPDPLRDLAPSPQRFGAVPNPAAGN